MNIDLDFSEIYMYRIPMNRIQYKPDCCTVRNNVWRSSIDFPEEINNFYEKKFD